MKRPQYVFRPNLNEPQHRRAWALLQQVPPAKRKEFLVQSILAAEQTDRLEKSIRKVVREELQAVNMPSVQNARPIAAKKGSSPRREERILGGSGCCRCLLYGGRRWRWLAAGSRA